MKASIHLTIILLATLVGGCVTKQTKNTSLKMEGTVSGSFRGVASIAESQSKDVKLFFYFAKNSQNEEALHRLLISDKNHDDIQSLAKADGIEVRVLQVKAGKEIDFNYDVPYVAKTIFINFSSQVNGVSSYRYNTISGNRFKTTLTLRENQLVAEQTPF